MRRVYQLLTPVAVGLCVGTSAWAQWPKPSKNGALCPPDKPVIPEIAEHETYRDTFFQPGEVATYEVRYFGVLAGYGSIEVKKPKLYEGRWHRVFEAEAKTGDWFRMIYVARDNVVALSRPWDWGVASFFMDQDEGKMFGTRFVSKKWLEFDHDACKVQEREKLGDKPERKRKFGLSRGAIDALGVLFNMRQRDYKMGKEERAPVYTSEKNWFLDAKPIAFETVEVPAGTFETVKLKLQTYLGKDLQQKGDVYAWVATKDPGRPLVQMQGEIKIGSIWMKLAKYTRGKPIPVPAATPTPVATPTPSTKDKAKDKAKTTKDKAPKAAKTTAIKSKDTKPAAPSSATPSPTPSSSPTPTATNAP